MPRRHGRNGAVYLGATTGAVATPLTFQAAWSINMASDRDEVTAFGDDEQMVVYEEHGTATEIVHCPFYCARPQVKAS